MAKPLEPGLYVMCYHDVRWAEPEHLRGLGICLGPDRFLEHLNLYTDLGEIVTLDRGLEMLGDGGIRSPLFALTFDDGYRGVLDHAAPAMARFGAQGLLAINHGFLGGASVFWRAQLCWIRNRGALDKLAERLFDHGYRSGSVRDFTMDEFSEEVLGLIDEVYLTCDGPDRERDLALLHLTGAEVVGLRDTGWEIANHSTRHLPLLEPTASHAIEIEFETCESQLQTLLGAGTSRWVAPFDRPLNRSADAVTAFRRAAGSRSVVLVDDRRTQAPDRADNVIYRVFAPAGGNTELSRRLRRAARRSKTLAPHHGPML